MMLGCQMVVYLGIEMTQDYSKSWIRNEHWGLDKIGFSDWRMIWGWHMTTVQVQEKKGCSGWKLLEDAKTVVCPLHWGFGWQNAHLKWFPSLSSAYSMPDILLCAICFSLLVCHISCVKINSNPRWGLGLDCWPLALVQSCCHLLTLWKSRRLVICKCQKKI